jgi:hypothetical protein
MGFSRFDLDSESIFKFLLAFKIRFSMQNECMMPSNMSALYVPHQKKRLTKYRWCKDSQWQFALIPVVSSSGMTHANVVSVPAEEHNRYMTYITTYPSSGTRIFNAARTALHMLRERIHVLRKRQQDIPTSPRPRCAVVASHTTDIQPLPYDRDCP